MLNMKKGLAIVLAAATALTFAPVSTLGLTGVVEVQAEETINNQLSATLEKNKSAYFGWSDGKIHSFLIFFKNAEGKDTLIVPESVKISDQQTEKGTAPKDSWTQQETGDAKGGTGWTVNTSDGKAAYTDGKQDWIQILNSGDKTVTYTVVEVQDRVFAGGVKDADALKSSDELTKLLAQIDPNTNDDIRKQAVSNAKTNNTPDATTATVGDVAVEAAKSGVTVSSADKNTEAEINKAISDNAPAINKSIADKISNLKDKDGKLKDGVTQEQVDKLEAQQKKVNDITDKAKSNYAQDTVTEKASDTFGGVTTDLLLTDDTSYSLVNSDATFTPSDNSATYTADQLKWYLTKTPSTDPTNIRFTESAGAITESGTGKLDIKVSNAQTFSSEMKDAYIVGVYPAGADTKIVYNKKITVTPEKSGVVTRHYDAATISADKDTVNGTSSATDKELSKNFLNDVQLIGTNNRFLDGSNSKIADKKSEAADATEFTKTVTGKNFTVELNDYDKNDGKSLKDSKIYINSSNTIAKDGVYYETLYVPYVDTKDDRLYIAEISVKVSVNAGPVVSVKDGDFVYSLPKADDPNRDEKVIDLDLTTNKTFDIAAHSYSSIDNTTYDYSVDTQNITVNKGVATAAKVGTAVVTITPSANGVKGSPVYLFFRVNKNTNDKISVTGKDGDKATVLTTREFNANNARSNYALKDSEANLAAAQVGYVQIEVTGDEASDVKEDLTVTGTGKLSFSLADDNQANIASVDAKTGRITVKHDYLNTTFKASGKPVVIPVKVVSTETASSALTTGYFYVVVDYADATISGLQDTYTVGTSIFTPDSDAFLNLGKYDTVKDAKGNETAYGPHHISANGDFDYTVLTKDYDLDAANIYENDESSAFDNDSGTNDFAVKRGLVAGKTEHVLVKVSDKAHKVGQTYRVVTINSVAGQQNYVSKIENKDTGKTIYQQGAGVNTGASITINKPTVVKVTVAHTPAATLNVNTDPAFTLGNGGNRFNYNTNNEFIAATENPNTYEVTLIPSAEGTNIVLINPTQGRLSETDYSLISKETFSLAVKYKEAAQTKTPAKVKNVKVTNRKGAKVVVKFTKDTTDKNIKYYVQKKVGKKTSGKSVGSNRTILSVAKGKTVKVRVKAYYYDANGTKHVGKYSKWVTKKTDKK